MPDYNRLLYTLEKIKANCPNKFGVFHTWEGSPSHEDCIQLAEDGIIQQVSFELDDDGKHHCMWKLP